ncbi:hypothetical protein [uncultured Desulfovibrio sp.]|uniref:hypothetical protein n=2 Tax=uncultured Desulfovibrio sp. TaxID=167968 RepID=UPI00261C60C7|nr:hypothetical protein [uncultured Desulfovibrio sp.]
MRGRLVPALMMTLLLLGCAATGREGTGSAPEQVALSAAAPGGGANAFNPYMQTKLPNTRELTAEGQRMLGAMGGAMPTIEGEAAHRRNWRDEIYPVVFGERTAPHEILVLLDFSSPRSAEVWKAVVKASRSLSPQQCKIAVFGNSTENYGTDLLGLAIWIAHSRPGQAMPYLTYALDRWNEVKAAQRRAGNVRTFKNEYDATASATDYPIHYGYLSRLRPPVPAADELDVARYCYDAGNVNMYQTTQLCRYYGVNELPAVIVDGRPLGKVSADAILKALR